MKVVYLYGGSHPPRDTVGYKILATSSMSAIVLGGGFVVASWHAALLQR
jgi:hypothetical protein